MDILTQVELSQDFIDLCFPGQKRMRECIRNLPTCLDKYEKKWSEQPTVKRICKAVVSKESRLVKSFDDLPLCLNVGHISEVMDISEDNAYALMHREDFPTVFINKRMVVPKDAFRRWLEENTQNNHQQNSKKRR